MRAPRCPWPWALLAALGVSLAAAGEDPYLARAQAVLAGVPGLEPGAIVDPSRLARRIVNQEHPVTARIWQEATGEERRVLQQPAGVGREGRGLPVRLERLLARVIAGPA
ncbi:MAG: hypothetical protein IT204_15350, partial [Fimbriimonadaceae bacterium]|nr:hypothetical protein [Fimbriimonadaceae bacterium]